jgi:hypothetical protein
MENPLATVTSVSKKPKRKLYVLLLSRKMPTRNTTLEMLLVTLNRILVQSPVPVNDCRFAKVGRTKAQVFISAHDDGTQHPLFCLLPHGHCSLYLPYYRSPKLSTIEASSAIRAQKPTHLWKGRTSTA